MAYESHKRTTQGGETSSQGIAFKDKEVMINQAESDESGDDEEDNITFLARKLNCFLKK